MATKSPTRPKRLTREEAKAQTRALLLETARNMFAQRGYDATALEEIAAEAGFTKGAMYFHFASKDALFLELLTIGLRTQTDEINGLIDLAATSPDSLTREFRRWLDDFDENPIMPLLGVELQMAVRRNPAMAQQFAEILGNYQLRMAEFLRNYLRITGRKPAVPLELLPATIVAVTEGLALNRQTQGRDAVASMRRMILLLLGDDE